MFQSHNVQQSDQWRSWDVYYGGLERIRGVMKMSGQMKGSKTYVSSLIIVFFISIETEKFHLKIFFFVIFT